MDKPTDGRGHVAIGVDVGGSGIKAAAVDTSTGQLVTERLRVPTPVPSAPDAIVDEIGKLVAKAERAVGDGTAPVGVGFPAVVIDGVTKSAANIDAGWVDFDAQEALSRAIGRPVVVVNDADAAGVAEMRFGAGVGRGGTVFVVTLGTGFGSALFSDGRLVPNLELGHMEIRGRDAERRSASAARIRRGLSWKAWADDLDEHLHAIAKLFSPKLFILGGGVSKNSDRFIPRLTVDAEVVPARLGNEAGIVGAAMFAAERVGAGAPAPDAEAAAQPAPAEAPAVEAEALAAIGAKGAEPEAPESPKVEAEARPAEPATAEPPRAAEAGSATAESAPKPRTRRKPPAEAAATPTQTTARVRPSRSRTRPAEPGGTG